MPEKKKKSKKENTGKVVQGVDRALLCARAAIEMNAEDPVILDVCGMTSFTDYFVIVTGQSNTQIKAITEKVIETLKKAGARPLGIEGEREARWVLIDYGDVIMNVFYHEEREFYELEKLWGDAKYVECSFEDQS